MRAYHTNLNFKEDKSNVHYYIEETKSITSYVASIKPHRKKKNGRDSFVTLVAQYTGEDKWQKLLKYSSDIL